MLKEKNGKDTASRDDQVGIAQSNGVQVVGVVIDGPLPTPGLSHPQPPSLPLLLLLFGVH